MTDISQERKIETKVSDASETRMKDRNKRNARRDRTEGLKAGSRQSRKEAKIETDQRERKRQGEKNYIEWKTPPCSINKNSTRDATKSQTRAFAVLSTFAFAVQTPTNFTS